jgi:chaperonin GroEL
LILVTDFPLKDAEDVLPILELASSAGRSLVLIAPEVRDAALAILIANRERGILAVKPPEPGGQKERAIEEIALISGARLQRRARNDRLRDVKLADLGSTRQAWATRGLAGLFGARGDREAIRVRLGDVRSELERASDDDARDKLRARIGRLAGIAAIVRVGGQTESEQKELEQRVESAVAAGRAALREGVVPGGGCALIAAAKAVSALDLTGDERVGAQLLARSLEEPLRVIAINAGIDDSPLVHNAYERGPDAVFDVLHRTWVDPWQSGILDATSILRQVIELSVSSAVTTLFTDTLVRSPTPANALTP